MAHIQEYHNLTDDQLVYLIDGLARFRSPERAQEEFKKFFSDSVSGAVVLHVYKVHKEEISKRIDEYAKSFTDIPIANTRVQLEMLQELYTLCLTPEAFGVSKTGEVMYKTDKNTARQCVKDSELIVSHYLDREQNKQDVTLLPEAKEDDEPSGGSIQVINYRKDE